ncbi:phage tail assembly protein T [Pseudomonas lactis]|uniref:phage tail assembly protein T n=1 Tax=Pseudomonas lactis TaxID=1615674 RepID=UPI0030B9A4FE
MLNGIGGRTIAEAKANLTYNEALSWMAYVEQNGSLNLGLKLEKGFALLATILNNVHGGKASFEDFLPQRGEPEEEAAASPQDLLRILQSVKR